VLRSVFPPVLLRRHQPASFPGVRPASHAVALRLGRPRGEQDRGLPDPDLAAGHAGHHIGDGHLDGVFPGEFQHRPRRLHALGHLGRAGPRAPPPPPPWVPWVARPGGPAGDMPRPGFPPWGRLRAMGELQVAPGPPMPASPANVCWSAPSAAPSLAISASPRVISMAVVLTPRPMPMAMPTAIAITFLTAPPSSHPTTSGLVYGRK